MKPHVFLALNCAFAGGLGCAQKITAETPERLYPKQSALWSNWSIPVCWENRKDAMTERAWVRSAIKNSWEANSAVRFVGWGDCTSSSGSGIRIQVADEGPHTKGLGSELDGRPAGMVLNFAFTEWSPACATQRQFCIEVIAVHEFGHALGIAHEQNRPDTPGWCSSESQGSDGDFVVGPWDLQSVMNYCNPRWSGDGKLSENDKEGISRLYGGYNWLSRSQVLGDGGGVHAYPTLVGDVNGDGRTDLIFIGQGWDGKGLNIRTKLSNGDGTWTSHSQVLGDGAGVHAHPTLVGDVNGDGRTDLIFIGQDWSGKGLNIRTKLSKGNGTWTSRSQALGDGAGVHAHPTLVGDVNGDGRTDLIFIGQDWSGKGLNIRTKLSKGNGTWKPYFFDVLGDPLSIHTYPPHFGRVNNDDKGDLIFVGQGWSGPGLNVRTKLSR